MSGEEPGEIRSIGGTQSGYPISNLNGDQGALWISDLPSASRNQLNICKYIC